jgi:SNF2-related domain
MVCVHDGRVCVRVELHMAGPRARCLLCKLCFAGFAGWARAGHDCGECGWRVQAARMVCMHVGRSGVRGVQSLAVMRAFRDEWPALVIAPVSLRENWAIEAHAWLACGAADARVAARPADMHAAVAARTALVIASYELFAQQKDLCAELKRSGHFRVVVCDESHRIKNHKVCACMLRHSAATQGRPGPPLVATLLWRAATAPRTLPAAVLLQPPSAALCACWPSSVCMQAQCTKAILPLLQRARRAILLSGTPALSKPAELLPQLQALLPGSKLTISEFAQRYCAGDRFDALKGSNKDTLDELNMVLVRCSTQCCTFMTGAACAWHPCRTVIATPMKNFRLSWRPHDSTHPERAAIML